MFYGKSAEPGSNYMPTIHSISPRPSVSLVAAMLFALAPHATACQSALVVREASATEIRQFVRSQRKKVVTFVGYSGAEYQDRMEMLNQASRALSRQNLKRTLVNVGATTQGIGAVYELAKSKGFQTMGIVSILARDKRIPLSPCVDYVFYVRDATWGGRLAGDGKLSPTSAAIVANSHAFVGIGGGEIARDELMAARTAGKPVTFVAADMNHQVAKDKARKRGAPEPTDFRGQAHAEFGPGT